MSGEESDSDDGGGKRLSAGALREKKAADRAKRKKEIRDQVQGSGGSGDTPRAGKLKKDGGKVKAKLEERQRELENPLGAEKYRDEFDPFAMAWPTGDHDTFPGRENRKNIETDNRFNKHMNTHERKEALYLNHYEYERNVDQKDKYWREWEKTNMADQYDFFHYYGNFA